MIYEVEDFRKNGFAGPFHSNVSADVIDQAAAFVKKLTAEDLVHPRYGRHAVRDWHLEQPAVLALFQDEGVVERLGKILGEDLVLWRTKVFNRPPKSGPVDFHQDWGSFNGEEIGNDIPALQPAHDTGEFWDLVVWVALEDITMHMAPMHFARGTHKRHFPTEMLPLATSGFFVDPLPQIHSKEELMRLCSTDSLVDDIKTSHLFSEADIENPAFTLEDAKAITYAYLNSLKGATTKGFDPEEHEVICQELKKGDYWIFTERTMHGSRPNKSDKQRVAINGRFTMSDTLIYPERLNGQFMDGSNIDISRHECVLLSGVNKEKRNVYGSITPA